MIMTRKAFRFPLQVIVAVTLVLSAFSFGLTKVEASSAAKDAYIEAEKSETEAMTNWLESRFEKELEWAEQMENNASESILTLRANVSNLEGIDPQIESLVNASFIEFTAQQDLNAAQALFGLNASIGGANISDILFAIDNDYLIADLPFYDVPITVSEQGINRLMTEYGNTDGGEIVLSDFFEVGYDTTGFNEVYVDRFNDVIYNTLSEDSFSQENVDTEIRGEAVQAELLTMSLTEAEIHEVLNAIIEEIRNDDALIETLASQLETQMMLEGRTVSGEDELNSAIDNVQEEINNTKFPQGLTSNIYVVDGTVLKREFTVEVEPAQSTDDGTTTYEEEVEEDAAEEVEEVEEGTEEDATEEDATETEGTEDDATDEGTEEDATEDGTEEEDVDVEDGTEEDDEDSASVGSKYNTTALAQESSEDEDEEGTEEDATEEGTEEDATEEVTEEEGTEDDATEEGTEEETTEVESVEVVNESFVIDYVSQTTLTETGSVTDYTISVDDEPVFVTLTLNETETGFEDSMTLSAEGEELVNLVYNKNKPADGVVDYTMDLVVGPVDDKVNVHVEGEATYGPDSVTGSDRISLDIPDTVTMDQLTITIDTDSRLLNEVDLPDTTNAEDISDYSTEEVDTLMEDLSQRFENWFFNLIMNANQ